MKQLLTTHDTHQTTYDGHPTITIAHHELMAQVSSKSVNKNRFSGDAGTCHTVFFFQSLSKITGGTAFMIAIYNWEL